jgi:CRP/FNR family transcriptional regulator
MLTPEQYARLAAALPYLLQADPALAREVQQAGFFVRLPAGRDVFTEGQEAGALALLISGRVRVYKIGETGRELTLYRFGLGESCILTANAILSQQTFPALATVEHDAEAVMIPAEVFRAWVQRYAFWRSFVFDLLSQRLAGVMALVEEVAFRRMDARVAGLLLARAASPEPIHVTHQTIAAELGSSREVVSRLIEDFASQGLIRAARGTIAILDRPGLERRAAG